MFSEFVLTLRADTKRLLLALTQLFSASEDRQSKRFRDFAKKKKNLQII